MNMSIYGHIFTYKYIISHRTYLKYVGAQSRNWQSELKISEVKEIIGYHIQPSLNFHLIVHLEDVEYWDKGCKISLEIQYSQSSFISLNCFTIFLKFIILKKKNQKLQSGFLSSNTCIIYSIVWYFSCSWNS